MPITSRPDLLPFALPSELGCPYHGLVVNGVLTLPNATTQVRSRVDGETVYVQHPKATTPARTAAEQAADTAAGRQWKNYALLSGAERLICNQQLGPLHWLYCDANRTWIVSLEDSHAGITRTLDCYLEGVFGLFTDQDVSMTRRKLATVTYTPKQYDGSDQTSGQALIGRSVTSSHSKTGAKTAINIGAATSGTQPWDKTYLTTILGDISATIGFHDAFELDITGNGSTAAGSVGSGISASFSSLATAPEMILEESSTLESANCDGQTYSSESQSKDYRYFYAVDKEGAVTSIRYELEYLGNYEYDGLDCQEEPLSPIWSEQRLVSTRNETFTFGGQTLTANTEAVTRVTPYPGTISSSVNGIAGTAGSIIPHYVHPNVVLFWLIAGAASDNLIVAADGTVTTGTWADDYPNAANTTWEPGAGVITFTEGVTQCYV